MNTNESHIHSKRMCEVVRERDEVLAKVAKMRATGSSAAEQSLAESTGEDTIANVTKKRVRFCIGISFETLPMTAARGARARVG